EENILTAAEFAQSWQHGWDARAAAREAIELLGLEDVAQQDVTELSSGHGRLVEVARAVALRPKVLLRGGGGREAPRGPPVRGPVQRSRPGGLPRSEAQCP